jgi:hypothetical protein
MAQTSIKEETIISWEAPVSVFRFHVTMMTRQSVSTEMELIKMTGKLIMFSTLNLRYFSMLESSLVCFRITLLRISAGRCQKPASNNDSALEEVPAQTPQRNIAARTLQRGSPHLQRLPVGIPTVWETPASSV